MLLQMRNITKQFGSVIALDHVSLEVNHSEIHGLLGENGAGKSTLMNILAGTFPPTAGEIYLNGRREAHMTTRKATDLGIRFIRQELNLINDLKIFENLFLGEEITNRYGILDKRQMIQRSRSVFERMQLEMDPEEEVANLDTSRKQLVEIAKALLFESRLIIMDEPTTALTNKEIENLFTIMRSLKKDGVSIIYISHKMPELFEIADRYTVLRDGKLVATGYFKDIDEKKVTELLVGRNIIDEELRTESTKSGTVLQVNNLTCAPFFENISFEVKQGEVLAITGLHGDGRGELAEALFGARPVTGGEIRLNNQPVNLKNIRTVMRQGIGMVPRNRKERSILPDMNILDNLSISYFVLGHQKVLINKREEQERFQRNQAITGIKVGDTEDYITALSGGNQQKVILSRWLEVDSDVYILDNPTQGIDVGAKFEIYKIIRELARQGKSIIVFSTEFPEIYKVADRCLVMYKGRINAQLTHDELNEVTVMYYATGSNMEGIG